VERGKLRAAAFTWKQSARRTLALFEEVGRKAASERGL
jgi:hypothetical protein